MLHQCPVCRKGFRNAHILKQHTGSSSSSSSISPVSANGYRCSACSARPFCSPRALQQHLESATHGPLTGSGEELGPSAGNGVNQSIPPLPPAGEASTRVGGAAGPLLPLVAVPCPEEDALYEGLQRLSLNNHNDDILVRAKSQGTNLELLLLCI